MAIERLSQRQREILEALAQGLTNDEIGSQLHISPATVRTHVTAVLAQLQVKNRTEAVAAYLSWEVRPARVEEVLGRPAIAVLPLVAFDDDSRARTAAGGIASDLTSLFARWCWFPVIASASVDPRPARESVREAGQRLAARFIVDGALRTAPETWRLEVHADDAETGYRIWTERYDFPREELFKVQDAVCEAVVAEAYPTLVARVQSCRRRPSPPEDLQAWELAHEGMRLQAEREAETSAAAERRFRAALEREPDLVLAHYGLGLLAYDQVLNQWGSPAEARGRLLSCADRCVELAPHAAEGHYLRGRHHQTSGDHGSAARALEAAIARNPSFVAAHVLLAQALQLSGRSDEALARMKHAMRLGPRAYVAGLATLHFIRGEYAEALEGAERAVASNPRYTFARVLAVACAHWLGDAARAREHARALRTGYPAFAPSSFLASFGAEVSAVQRIARSLDEIGVTRIG